MRNWLLLALAGTLTLGAAEVKTIAGTGKPGFTDDALNNPYGLVTGPDGALYICDIDNHMIRRLDLKTKKLSTVAGSGQKGYAGDGGPALQAQLNQPYEIRFDRAGTADLEDSPSMAREAVVPSCDAC